MFDILYLKYICSSVFCVYICNAFCVYLLCFSVQSAVCFTSSVCPSVCHIVVLYEDKGTCHQIFPPSNWSVSPACKPHCCYRISWGTPWVHKEWKIFMIFNQNCCLSY